MARYNALQNQLAKHGAKYMERKQFEAELLKGLEDLDAQITSLSNRLHVAQDSVKPGLIAETLQAYERLNQEARQTLAATKELLESLPNPAK